MNNITKLIKDEFDKITKNWFPQNAPTLEIEFPKDDDIETASVYDEKRNKIILRVMSHNINDNFDNADWSSTQLELYHELLHAYQATLDDSCVDNSKVKELRIIRKSFVGPGHCDRFYQAIIDKAAYFGLKPDEFVKRV
ncbi:MAG: hypothetical protein NTW12_15520 [Deltaproteobacteria bacterium]|nr:hypothetical protein [Deltaproteobacteria bacterium]